MVDNSPLYLDQETDKPRELDVHAVNVDFSLSQRSPKKVNASNENKLISHLVIQCKKSEKPWVFFDNGDTRWLQIPPSHFKCNDDDFIGFEFSDLVSYGLNKNRLINALLHKSFYESFSDPKYSSKIFESLVTSIKAMNYFKNIYGTGEFVIHIFIPLIVVDGTLWSAKLVNNKNNTPQVTLKKVKSLFVVFNQLEKIGESNLPLEEEYVIEIVTRDSFQKYLSTIERDNSELYRCWTNFINT